jgi:Resolvase, N terminal domain
MMVRRTDTREPKPVIAYVRVSTTQQGKSGLGLEAQREAIDRFAKAEGFHIVESFVEIESAKGDTLARRPKLQKALAAAKRIKDDDYRYAPVIVAKLDRLLARRCLYLRADDQARALHLRRPRARHRPFHAPHLRGVRRKRAAHDFHPHEGRPRPREGAGREARRHE